MVTELVKTCFHALLSALVEYILRLTPGSLPIFELVIVHCAAERRPDVVEKNPDGAKNVSIRLALLLPNLLSLTRHHKKCNN